MELAHAIESRLIGPAKEIRLKVYPSLSSTNEMLKELAVAGAPAGTAVLALEQTAGKGRKGRRFFSPPGTGLYLSLLLRPQIAGEHWTLITPAAAVAAAEAIEAVSGRQAGIKWVNDIYLDGKKACGILTETVLSQENKNGFAVLGVGVNLTPPLQGFPAELEKIATAVFQREVYRQACLLQLTAEILNRFMHYYVHLERRTFFQPYREKMFILGREVAVLQGESRRLAKVVDVDEACRLVVRYEDGNEGRLSSGEISIGL